MFNFLATLSETQAFLPVIILLGISTAIAIILSFLKISLVPDFVVEIFIGMILGTWFFHFTEVNGLESVNEALYTIGLVFLLFLSGLDIDYHVFKIQNNQPVNKIKVSGLSMVLIAAIYGLSFIVSLVFKSFFGNYFLGNSDNGTFVLTVCLATTFASIVVPILHQKDIGHTTIGQVISTYSILSELLCIVLLSGFMIVNEIKEKTSPMLVLLIIVVLALTYLAMKFIPAKHFKKVSIGLVNLGLRLIVVVILLLVWLSERTGGELILGAFLVGMVLKGAHISHRVEERLHGFGYGIFIPMFFIILGTRIPLFTLLENPSNLLITLYLTLAILFVKIPFIYLLRWYKLNVAIPTMILVSCTIIASVAAEEMEVFTESFAHSLIIASVLTCLIPPIVFEWLFPFKHCHNKFECEEYITVKENE